MISEMASTRKEKFVYLHDKERIKDLFSGLKLLHNAKVVEVADEASEPVAAPVEAPASSRSCSYCQVQFESLEDQREHFKLDWHRYNLKQSLAGKKTISEEAFEAVLKDIEADEDNEISASDSDDDSDDSDSDHVTSAPSHIQGTKVQFLGSHDTVLSINKCLILDPKCRDHPSDSDLVTLLENAPRRLTWAVLMLGGGHFAGDLCQIRTMFLNSLQVLCSEGRMSWSTKHSMPTQSEPSREAVRTLLTTSQVSDQSD